MEDYLNFNTNLWLNINVSFELYSVTGGCNIYYILHSGLELYFQFSSDLRITFDLPINCKNNLLALHF